MLRIGLLFLLVMGAMLPRFALAVDLYSTAVPVSGQGAAERRAAVRAALGQVLVKVTGDGQVVTNPGVRAALQGAPGMVVQYRYELKPTPVEAGQQPLPPVREIIVQFDARAINDLLARNDLPVWDQARPTTLLWLAVDDGENGRFLLGGDSSAEAGKALVEGIDQSARRRGLSITLPLMDLEDQMNLRFTDVWGDFAEPVEQASRRYDEAVTLTGRLGRDGNGWRGSWTLYQGNNPARWETRDSSMGAAAYSGVEMAADVLASRFAPLATDSGASQLHVEITGIEDTGDYAGVMNYLRSLTPVKSVRPVEARGDRLQVALELQGSVQTLTQIIGLGSLLAAASVEEEAPAAGVDLVFRVNK